MNLRYPAVRQSDENFISIESSANGGNGYSDKRVAH
jgi:hypothetical protein